MNSRNLKHRRVNDMHGLRLNNQLCIIKLNNYCAIAIKIIKILTLEAGFFLSSLTQVLSSPEKTKLINRTVIKLENYLANCTCSCDNSLNLGRAQVYASASYRHRKFIKRFTCEQFRPCSCPV